MAKLILYLHAKSGRSIDLIHTAHTLVSTQVFEMYRLQLAIMKPRSADLLAIPSDSEFLAGLDAVLEIVSPCGQALRPLQAGLHDALTAVLDLVDKSRSHVVAGYSRTFQEVSAKPIRYHYLMYRHANFSRADYLDYYVHSHSRFGLASPLADYYQNYLDQDEGRELARLFGIQCMEADSISELRFDSVESYLGSDIIRKIGPAASADEELFVNRKLCQSFSMNVLLDKRG